jgi:putative hemolysin
VAIFAAGAMATPDKTRRLVDPPWHPTAVSLARKYGAPVLPVHVAGPWSTMFNIFHRFSPELRDITLFHELLNKTGKRFEVIIGPPIAPRSLDGDAGAITVKLKAYVERVLPAHPDQPFAP